MDNQVKSRIGFTTTIAAILMASFSHVGAQIVEEAEATTSTQGVAPAVQAASSRPFEPEVTELLNLAPVDVTSVRATNPDGQVANLVDGRIVVGSNYEAVGTGDGCTSSLIGPKVLLTAAHCVDGNGWPAFVRDISFSPRKNASVRLNYTCTMHPQYQNAQPRGKSPRSSHDIALCILQNTNDLPIGTKFEVVDLNQVPTVGKKILMTGYGCTGSDFRKYYDERLQRNRYIGYVKGSSDGYFRVGDAEITETKTDPYFQNQSRTQAIIESHALINGLGAKLCPGDSGGPVFSGISQNSQQGPRRIIGVNSSVGGIVSDSLPVTIISNLVDFNDITIQDFFKNFTSTNNVSICGYGNTTAGTGSCRP